MNENEIVEFLEERKGLLNNMSSFLSVQVPGSWFLVADYCWAASSCRGALVGALREAPLLNGVVN